MATIKDSEGNADIFIHHTKKTVLFKKKNNIRGGKDIRIINILSTWLVILEKIAYVKIKQILQQKITNFQFGLKKFRTAILQKPQHGLIA